MSSAYEVFQALTLMKESGNQGLTWNDDVIFEIMKHVIVLQGLMDEINEEVHKLKGSGLFCAKMYYRICCRMLTFKNCRPTTIQLLFSNPTTISYLTFHPNDLRNFLSWFLRYHATEDPSTMDFIRIYCLIVGKDNLLQVLKTHTMWQLSLKKGTAEIMGILCNFIDDKQEIQSLVRYHTEPRIGFPPNTAPIIKLLQPYT